MIIIESFKQFILNELKSDLAKELSSWASNNSDKLPFNSLFNGNLRVLIDLNPENIVGSILTKLKNKGKINFSNGTVEYGNKSLRIGKFILNPNSIFTRQEKEWWNRSPDPVQQLKLAINNNYSIIISRHPIDIARMSDHMGLNSCHSPGGNYFKCALTDAKGFGAIAYLVRKQDVENLDINEYDEIFEDKDRRISGIRPLARIRLRKLINKKEDWDLALPEDRIYGTGVPGFKSTLINWAKISQEDKLKGRRLRSGDFYLVGASYQDTSSRKLLNAFFNDELDHEDVEYQGEDDYESLYRQHLDEFKQIQNKHSFEHDFKYNYYLAPYDDGNGYYMSGSATIKFIYPIKLKNDKFDLNKSYENSRKMIEIFSKEFHWYGIEELNIYQEDENLVFEINFNEDFEDPHGYDEFLDGLEEIDKKYDENKIKIFHEFKNIVFNPTTAHYFHYYEEEGGILDNLNLKYFKIENLPNEIVMNLINPIPLNTLTVAQNANEQKESGYYYYNYDIYKKDFSNLFYKYIEAQHKKLLFIINRQKKFKFPDHEDEDEEPNSLFNVNLKPEIEINGEQSFKSITLYNKPFVSISLKFNSFTHDDDLEEIVKYFKYLDNNINILYKILNQINIEVHEKFKKFSRK